MQFHAQPQQNVVYLSTIRAVEEGVGRDTESDYDLYWDVDNNTPVARYGNKPHQVYFGFDQSFGEMVCLTEARQEAIRQGFFGYDVYDGLRRVLSAQEVKTSAVSICAEELMYYIKDSDEVKAFEAFRARDFEACSKFMCRLVMDAERRGVYGTIGFKLRLILDNILRLNTLVAALDEVEVNTVSIVKAMSYRAPKLVK